MEIWKDVVGYEGLYMVSSYGNVKTLGKGDSNNSRCEKVLTGYIPKNGYARFVLCEGGKMSGKSGHRLVAEAFIPNPENKPCVNHINLNKSDNRIENLEWCTSKENMQHASKNGKMKQSEAQKQRMSAFSKSRSGANHPSAKIILNMENGVFYNCTAEVADLLNIPHHKVWKMLNPNYRRMKNRTPLRYV